MCAPVLEAVGLKDKKPGAAPAPAKPETTGAEEEERRRASRARPSGTGTVLRSTVATSPLGAPGFSQAGGRATLLGQTRAA